VTKDPANRAPSGRGPARPPTARSVAADVQVRVLRDGAFAAAVLDVELDRNVQLDARDRALATELVYGSLRLRSWLEGRLARYAPRGLGSLDVHVRAHLLVAAYQLLVLTRVPAFAAVSEAVGAIRFLRGDKVGGFANAVLRKISREPRPSEEELARAALAGVEVGLARAMIASVGEEATLHLVTPGEAPPLGLRVERAEEREAWIERLRAARPDASIEPGALSPHAILVRGAGRLGDLPGWEEGAWTAQEEGSQVIALALGARPAEAILDACAGRGNKTGLLARAVLPSGTVDAADLHPSKLEHLEQDLSRLGLAPGATFAVDWSKGAGAARPPYDRVLVDAPCSGTGTIRRRPELLLRRAGADVAELAALQRAILARAASLVRPGGRVVYAVCSVLAEEAESVVSAAAELDLEPAPFDPAPGALEAVLAGATTLRLLPHLHGTDGYFLASFRRRDGAQR